MGEGKHVRFSLRSGSGRAQGVGFRTGGVLPMSGDGPHDATVKLEANAWNGAVEPRAVLRHLHPVTEAAACGSPCATCPERALKDEWWARVDEARREPLDAWPAERVSARIEASGLPRREVVDRRGSSPVASVGELLSTGERVLALCADVSRRRRLAEEAAGPPRFGLGPAVLTSARCATGPMEARLAAGEGGGGLVLSDYDSLAERPDMGDRFEHVVLVDPAPFEHLDRLAEVGRSAPWTGGFLHLAYGLAEIDFALKVHTHAWGLEAPLREVYASLRDMPEGADPQALLAGASRHPRTPAQAGRCLRVLEELGLLVEDENGSRPRLRALSSIRIDLERSQAFCAYRARLEEGIEWLSRRRQAN
jgi:single-stranded-DNA-specific exonuclease